MKTIKINPEHREPLETHILQIQACNELLVTAQAHFKQSKQRMELLGAAWKRMPKDDADKLDPVVIRNAEIMSHALNDAREAERNAAFQSSCIQALKEAMGFLLAEHYAVDIGKEWQLDLNNLTLQCQE